MASEAVHRAIQETIVGDGEVLTRWCLVAESVDGAGRYVMRHRAGTAGGDNPSASEAVGLLGSSLAVAVSQVLEATSDAEGQDE